MAKTTLHLEQPYPRFAKGFTQAAYGIYRSFSETPHRISLRQLYQPLKKRDFMALHLIPCAKQGIATRLTNLVSSVQKPTNRWQSCHPIPHKTPPIDLPFKPRQYSSIISFALAARVRRKLRKKILSFNGVESSLKN